MIYLQIQSKYARVKCRGNGELSFGRKQDVAVRVLHPAGGIYVREK